MRYNHENSSNVDARQLSTSSSSQDYLDVEMKLNGYLIPYASFNLKLTNNKHKQRIFSTQARQPKYPIVLQQYLELHILAKQIVSKLKVFGNAGYLKNMFTVFGVEELERVGLHDPRKQVSPSPQMMQEADEKDKTAHRVEMENKFANLTPNELDELLPTLFKQYFVTLDAYQQRTEEDQRQADETGSSPPYFSATPFLDLVEQILADVKQALHILTQPSVVC